jgi:hypothetical protein
MDRDSALVGAPFDDTTSGVDKGSAYVFGARPSGVWTFEAKLRDTQGPCATSVDLDGNRALIGGAYAARLFTRTGATWSPGVTIESGGPVSAVGLGEGDAVLVGRESAEGASGLVYLLQRVGSIWRLQEVLRTSGAAAGDRFGHALAVSSGRVLVGAPHADNAGQDAGSADVERIQPWLACGTEEATLWILAGGQPAGVAIQGELLAVGRPLWTNTSYEGRVFVFQRAGGSWTQDAVLAAADAAPRDGLGWAVGLDGDTLVAGAPGDDHPGGLTDAGSAYVFVRAGTSGWSQLAKLVASDASAGARFGEDLSLDGDTLVVAAPSDAGVGCAYVFVRTAGMWTEAAKLTAQGAGPQFGRSIAISADAIAVGSSGMVHVFRGSGAGWAQEDVLVMPAVDGFGEDIALYRDLLVVGASRDDFLGADAGSAHVYVRGGTSWTHVARLLAPDGEDRKRFGIFVATDGRTILVGSERDSVPVASGNFHGAAYAFAGSGASWVFQQKLVQASSNSSQDYSGHYGDVDADIAVIGHTRMYVFDLSGTFPSFCDASDGAQASCPCANPGDSGSGCELPQATGGVRLDVLSQRFLPQNRATLHGTGFPPASTPVIAVRAAALDPARPVVFGDGLRCVGVPLVRLATAIATAGSSTTAISHSAMAGAGTFFYQLWFRNSPITYCDPAAEFSLSSGRSMTW